MLILAQTFPQLLFAHAWKAAILTTYVTLLNLTHSPRIKMVIFAMPIPFTCAFLASGLKINASHMSGLTLVTLYHWLVYLLHVKWKYPLLPTIFASAGTYVLIAALIRPLSDVPFLFAIFPVIGLWFLGLYLYKPIHDAGQRSPTPWWVKVPGVFCIGLCLYFLTGLMGGAVASFPYAGVFTSYEMRRSLRILAGQFMINNLSGWFMLIAMWLVQDHVSGPLTLAAGWVAMSSVLGLIYWFELGRPPADARIPEPPKPIGEPIDSPVSQGATP